MGDYLGQLKFQYIESIEDRHIITSVTQPLNGDRSVWLADLLSKELIKAIKFKYYIRGGPIIHIFNPDHNNGRLKIGLFVKPYIEMSDAIKQLKEIGFSESVDNLALLP